MAIFNLGSINADMFYHVQHLPMPGETLAAQGHSRGLGGKGANQSVAAARAGSNVVHIGAVGADGEWAVDRLTKFAVNVSGISRSDQQTGHAIISVDQAGENSIVLWPGANHDQDIDQLGDTLAKAAKADILLLQNETDGQLNAAKLARDIGMKVVYSAAPFDVEAVKVILPYVDILAVNEVEAQQVSAALDTDIAKLPVPAVLITKGAEGATFLDIRGGSVHDVASPKVDAVDTTGAGDTFAGYFAAGLDQGRDIDAALKLAAAAAACKVTRRGTADAIPTADEVSRFMNSGISG